MRNQFPIHYRDRIRVSLSRFCPITRFINDKLREPHLHTYRFQFIATIMNAGYRPTVICYTRADIIPLPTVCMIDNRSQRFSGDSILMK